jgi:hypothetical protein
MRSASYLPSSDTPRATRRRTGSFLLAIAAHILIIWLLLRLAPTLNPPPREVERRPTTFSMLPEPQTTSTANSRTRKPVTAKTSGGAPPKRSVPTPVKTAPTTPNPVTPPFPKMLNLSLASSDISKIQSAPASDADADEGDGTGSGKDSGSTYGPGEGPGGVRLYNAEWYKEPSQSQLSFYMPRNVAKGSWATIACKTIPRFHVEDCRALDESPVGSGLSRAVRQAAWQFLVRPPRVGGKTMVGAWVRIRIDFTDPPSGPAK